MRHIALISPSTGGHHDSYLQIYTTSLLRLGHRVTVFTSRPDRINVWLAERPLGEQKRVDTVMTTFSTPRPALGPLSTLVGKYQWVQAMSAAVQRSGIQPDLLFHMWLDNCLTPGLTAWLTDQVVPYHWSGIYFHPWYLRTPLSFQHFRRGALASYAALMSTRCPAVAVLDEGIADELQRQLHGKPVIPFPDIADATPPDPQYAPAHEICRRARGRKVVSLLGALSRRKGTVLLMQSMGRLHQEEFFFVFAGVLDYDSYTPAEQRTVQEFAENPPENCYLDFSYIPNEGAFNALIAASDILFAAYLHFPSSSNLLTKAAIFQKPIVVSQGYCMGERVHKYGIGLAIPDSDTVACAEAIRQLRTQVPPERFANYAQVHSLSRLDAAFTQLICYST